MTTPNASQGCFVSIHVRAPTLQTKLTWADIGIGEVEGLASPPSARPPSEFFKKFSNVEQRMRLVLKKFTAGSEHGFRFMKYASWEPFKALIEPLREEYQGLVEPFLKGYEASRASAIEAWRVSACEMAVKLDADADPAEFVDRVTSKLERAWPWANELHGRFSTEVRVMFFAVPGEEVIAPDAVFTDVLAEAKFRARDTLDGFFAEAQNELRLRAVEVVRRMHAVLAKGDSIGERNINPLREFVTQFRELSVIPDSDFQKRLDALLSTIDARGGANGLRGSIDAWSEVQELLDETARAGEALAEASVTRRGTDLNDRMIEL